MLISKNRMIFSFLWDNFTTCIVCVTQFVDKHPNETSAVFVDTNNASNTNSVALVKWVKKLPFKKCFPFQKTFHHSMSCIMICLCFPCCSCFSHNYFTYARTHKIHNIRAQFRKWIHICFYFFLRPIFPFDSIIFAMKNHPLPLYPPWILSGECFSKNIRYEKLF